MALFGHSTDRERGDVHFPGFYIRGKPWRYMELDSPWPLPWIFHGHWTQGEIPTLNNKCGRAYAISTVAIACLCIRQNTTQYSIKLFFQSFFFFNRF